MKTYIFDLSKLSPGPKIIGTRVNSDGEARAWLVDFENNPLSIVFYTEADARAICVLKLALEQLWLDVCQWALITFEDYSLIDNFQIQFTPNGTTHNALTILLASGVLREVKGDE
jgi:hypothetical protein